MEREAIRSTTSNAHVRLSQADRQQLEQNALLNDRSLAAELRRAVRFYLERLREEAA